MKKSLGWALLLLLGLLPGIIHAQDSALDEAEFWARMQQTDALLQQALEQPDPTAIRTQALQLWQGVRQVRLSDAVIEVDMRWLTQPLSTGDAASLETLQHQVRALLDDHAQRVPITGNNLSLSALDDVLRDPRFQYTEVAPTPIPTQMPSIDLEPVADAVSPGFSQILLVAAGMIVVIGVLLYFARSLQIQPAALENAASSHEPATSAHAVDLAASYASGHDYRSAIRYLYLSSLLLLDERGLIHYDSTLTNHEHLRQVREQPHLHDLLRRVVNAFEDVWYGYAPVDEAFYQHYVQHIDQLRRFVP